MNTNNDNTLKTGTCKKCKKEGRLNQNEVCKRCNKTKWVGGIFLSGLAIELFFEFQNLIPNRHEVSFWIYFMWGIPIFIAILALVAGLMASDEIIKNDSEVLKPCVIGGALAFYFIGRFNGSASSGIVEGIIGAGFGYVYALVINALRRS